MPTRAEMSRAYQRALSRLRQRHDDEFHAMLAEVYAEMGLEVAKRASRKQVEARRGVVRQALSALEPVPVD